MIADQEVRVRHVIAEVIKTSRHIPKNIAVKLAHDDSVDVSCPVVEYSPLLNDEDLIEIIAGYIHSPVLEAVARRKPVSANIAEKLVDVLDTNAIAALLRNPDAHIRETALEKIVDAAHEIEEWHEPLAARPSLSTHAIRRICSFVADNLIAMLIERPELDDETRRSIAQKVSERLDSENARFSDEEAVVSEIRDELLVKQKLGKLNTAYLADAAKNEKYTVVSVALSVLTGLRHTTVRRAFLTRDVNLIATICWKAGMPMSLARLLQELVGKIDPRNCMSPNEDGGYPLSDSTLEWNFALCMDKEEEEAADTANQTSLSATAA